MKKIFQEELTDKWNETRERGKGARQEFTDAVRVFEKYAKDRGSQNAHRYYVCLTSAIYRALFPIGPNPSKGFRDKLNQRQLIFLGTAELIAANTLHEGMSKDLNYKSIYRSTKDRLETFAKVAGSINSIPQNRYTEEPNKNHPDF